MSTPVLFAINAPCVGDSATPAFAPADPAEPFVNVMDLAVTRGDGIFETAGIVDGRVQALDAHLTRFIRSARIMDLPEPDRQVWTEGIRAAVAAHEPGHELLVKFILTRGVEGTGIPTAWAYVTEAEDFTAVRTHGISVVTLSRGYRHDVAEHFPWLLQGAKTLSYAVNKAMLREAARRGADDVIMTSIDGYVLEGPSSTVVLQLGDRILTPRTDQGILAGTTQGSAFEFFEQQGLPVSYDLVPLERLAEADHLWLLSSSRLAAPVNAIDGSPKFVNTELSARLNDALLARQS